MHRRTQEDETRARRVFVCCLTLPQPSSSQAPGGDNSDTSSISIQRFGPRDPGRSTFPSFERYSAISRQKPFTRLYALLGFRSHFTTQACQKTKHKQRATHDRTQLTGLGRSGRRSLATVKLPMYSPPDAPRTFMENNKSCGAAVCCGAKIHAHEDASTLRALLSIQS